jgi:hypothetical protein
MKIKCSFIYETKEYDTFSDFKSEQPKASRKKIESNMVRELEHFLKMYFVEADVDSVSEFKAKIIERKDTNEDKV